MTSRYKKSVFVRLHRVYGPLFSLALEPGGAVHRIMAIAGLETLFSFQTEPLFEPI